MRRALAWLVSFALLIHIGGAPLVAKNGSSSGKSYSSGGRSSPSSSRPSSSGSGGKSYSSGGRSSPSRPAPSRPSGSSGPSSGGGKSYSSGGGRSSPSPSPAPSRPSGSSGPSSGGGKSYSSGGGTSAPSRPAPSAPSGSSGPSSGGGKSYSSGGGTSSPPARPTPNVPPGGSRPSSGGGHSYSSGGGTSYSSGGGSDSSSSRKPVAPRYDSLPAAEQRKAESRSAYQQAQAPRPSYTTPKGGTVTIDPGDRQVEDLRRQLDHERWVNREQRQRVFYGPYYARPPVFYNDPYNSFFWWWLLDQRLEHQAMWAYHYRSRMDPARYNDLLARNADLAARVRQLESANLPPDPAYVPPGVERDLLYADDYVDAVYNPEPGVTPVVPPEGGTGGAYAPVDSGRGSGIGRFFFWVFLLALIACSVWLVVWLVFYKRWNV